MTHRVSWSKWISEIRPHPRRWRTTQVWADHRQPSQQEEGPRLRLPAPCGRRPFRLAYSESHSDERKEVAAPIWGGARSFFAEHGIEVRTDNGSCYRSHYFGAALGPNVTHRYTRPYRPQTNGKVERLNRTLAAEEGIRPDVSVEARSTKYREAAPRSGHP